MAGIFPLLENGTIKPLIDSIYPLEQAEQAHAHMMSGTHMGKIVLKV